MQYVQQIDLTLHCLDNWRQVSRKGCYFSARWGRNLLLTQQADTAQQV